MKLDKRACRHAANVPLHISLNAGCCTRIG